MIYSQLDDKTLVTYTLLGDPSAYEALVLRYQRAVIAAAYGITHDHYLAEDAAQDAFVAAWAKLDSLHEPEKFGVWVCKISRNRAKNTVMRMCHVISYEELQNVQLEKEEQFPVFLSEKASNEKLCSGIQKLSKKVREVLLLHYNEGLSLSEISERLSVPVGTVKYRLHDARKKLRKEMEDPMEKNESFHEKVMKKVEALKQWRLKADKKGIEIFWEEVLCDVESLPESEEKYHALADVLNVGFWWCEGKKNDELMERMREAAEKGRNENVLSMLAFEESEKLNGKEKIAYIQEKQLPRLREAGYRQVEGEVSFWLGVTYADGGEYEKAIVTFESAVSLLPPENVYQATALAAAEITRERIALTETKAVHPYHCRATGEELRFIDGKLCFWAQPGFSRGGLHMNEPTSVLFYASRSDSTFYDPRMRVGEVMTASNGATLTFLEENATVETACGSFYGCQVWEIRSPKDSCSKTFYKPGIGIVRLERTFAGKTKAVTLHKYHIAGGTGLLPLAVGNEWDYLPEGTDERLVTHHNRLAVTFFDGSTAILSGTEFVKRIAFDEENWEEMIKAARCSYCDRDGKLYDVSHYMERASILAQTPYQKLHTRIANDVMQRIFDTSPAFTPDPTHRGHWNFFRCDRVTEQNGVSKTLQDRDYSFEWKNATDLKFENSGYSLLYNFVYDILEANAECLWNEAWKNGTRLELSAQRYGGMKTKGTLTVEDGGSVTTAAGSFEGCLVLRMDVSGYEGGWSYRGGLMEYWFAPSVGIVRAKHYYNGGKCCATYELVEYQGIGKGYFPVADGLIRKYEAVGLDCGFIGAVEYAFCQNDCGEMMLLSNQTGIRECIKQA